MAVELQALNFIYSILRTNDAKDLTSLCIWAISNFFRQHPIPTDNTKPVYNYN